MNRRRWDRGAGREIAGSSGPGAALDTYRVPVLIAMGVIVVGGVALGMTYRSPEPVTEATDELAMSGEMNRAFWPDSWWNTPLPDDPPLHPAGDLILDHLRNAPENGGGCLRLAGAGTSPWGQPIYWANSSHPEYEVTGPTYSRPPELDRLRIPLGARPALNNDASMTIYDLEKGYVTALSGAEYDPHANQWSASGATVTYLRSNGLNVATGRSDDPRNIGSHRGNNGATMMVSWDMVQAGAVRHVLKVASGPEVAARFVFPMVASDGDYDGDDPAVPANGLRFRLKPSVDVESLELGSEALVIARALQRYGFYIGDSGGSTALKLENTVAEGRGQLWEVDADALCALPFTLEYWDVLAEGYDPSE